MFESMLGNHVALLLTPFLLGLVAVAIAYASKRIIGLPAIQEIKSAYPLIDIAIMTASQLTNGSPYDYLFDAAAAVWGGREMNNEESARLVAATVEHFSKGKYKMTDKTKFNPELVRRGEELGRVLVEQLEKRRELT